MTPCVLLIMTLDSGPIRLPPNIAISPIDDEFWPRANQRRRGRLRAALLLQTAPSIQFQNLVEAVQMFVAVALALRQVQSRVRPGVGDAPVSHPGKLDAVHVGGHDGDADSRGDQADDGRGFQHFSYYPRAKSGLRGQVHDLPVDAGAGVAGGTCVE